MSRIRIADVDIDNAIRHWRDGCQYAYALTLGDEPKLVLFAYMTRLDQSEREIVPIEMQVKYSDAPERKAYVAAMWTLLMTMRRETVQENAS